MKTIIKLYVLLFVVSLLGACSSGGGGGTPTPTGEGPYVPFHIADDTLTPTGLKVVDSQSPNSVITLENSAVEQFNVFYQFDFNQTTQTVSNNRPAYAFYWKDSHFWRVSLAQGSNLSKQQVSSGTFDMICDEVNSPNEQLDPLDTVILFETAGPDGDCFGFANDNEIKVIRLGFNATDAALDATSLIPSLYQVKVLDTGFLTVTNDNVTFYDTNLANPVTLLGVTDPFSVAFADEDEQNGFIFADRELYWFNATNNTISSSLHSMVSIDAEEFACDITNCYFLDRQMDNTFSMYKVPANGSGSATFMVSGIDPLGGFIGQFSLTANYVFYIVEPINTPASLYRFPKSPAVNETPTFVDSENDMSFLFAGSDYIFYEKQTTNNIATTASTIIINNEALTAEQSLANSFLVGISDVEFSFLDYSADATIFIANGASGTNIGMGGASLQGYTLSTGSLTSTIGDIPDEIAALYMFFNPKFGNLRIGTALIGSTQTISGYQTDMYIIDPTATQIFTNVTNTEDAYEDDLFF
jgi:hypothetical protein